MVALRGGVVTLGWLASRTTRMFDWEPYIFWQAAVIPLRWRPRTVDGQPIAELYVMRRKAPDGTWQYRLQTDAEALEDAGSRAW